MSDRPPDAARDEFYVGYLPGPPGIRAVVRRRALLLVIGAAALGALLAADMRPFPAKVFEWGEPRTFEGWMERSPVPSLLVRRPGVTDPADVWTRYLLVRPGKFGAGAEADEFDGNRVELEGALIYREDQAMIEIVPGSVRLAAREAGGPDGSFESLGEHTLAGEIVDSKCYLGVMSPGSTKPHRACAARCIAGGIPPVFLVRRDDGRALHLLLLSRDGKTVNREVLPMIAEPLEITGAVERHHDLLVLKADPSTYRRRT
jgi:hypothetical protein